MINSLINNNNEIFSWFPHLYPFVCFIFTSIIAIFSILLLVYMERRVLALFTLRYGPNRVGKEGILQPVADAIKLLINEDSTPKDRRKVLFFAAPIIVFCPVMTAFCLIPFNDFFMQTNFNISVVLFSALVSIPVVGIFLAGFSSNNKYSLIGAIRSTAQVLSFEIPMGVCILATAFLAGGLNINEIIISQNSTGGLFGWNFLPLFIGAFVFFICALALLNRTPFDLSEAESELVCGYNTEYSGIKFALFFMTEYALLLLVSMFFASLFFGGYLSPFGTYILPENLVFLEQTFWLLLKTFITILLIILIRASLPRLRYDRLLKFSYLVLLPLSLINLNISILVLYFRGN